MNDEHIELFKQVEETRTYLIKSLKDLRDFKNGIDISREVNDHLTNEVFSAKILYMSAKNKLNEFEIKKELQFIDKVYLEAV